MLDSSKLSLTKTLDTTLNQPLPVWSLAAKQQNEMLDALTRNLALFLSKLFQIDAGRFWFDSTPILLGTTWLNDPRNACFFSDACRLWKSLQIGPRRRVFCASNTSIFFYSNYYARFVTELSHYLIIWPHPMVLHLVENMFFYKYMSVCVKIDSNKYEWGAENTSLKVELMSLPILGNDKRSCRLIYLIAGVKRTV
jgi:hypothetical protein